MALQWSSRALAMSVLIAVSSVLPTAVFAGEPAPSHAWLRLTPACASVGERVNLSITVTGLRPGERVGFSGHPLGKAFGGGNLGVRRAGAHGRIHFTYPAPTQKVAVWVIGAERASGESVGAFFQVRSRNEAGTICPPVT